MNVRTIVNTSHLARLSVVACFCLGLSLWALYDGTTGWPNQQKRAEAFIEFKEEQEALIPRPDLKDIADNWNVYATEQGWPTGYPGEPREDPEIFQQFVMAAVAGMIGLFFLIQLIRWKGRWIEATDGTITSNRGHEFQLDQIIELDKKKWDKKGIASLKFEVGGRTGQLALDDCNYQRDTTQQILRHIEAGIDHAKIANGKPEPPLEEKEAAVEETV
jgi:hypothetical protein